MTSPIDGKLQTVDPNRTDSLDGTSRHGGAVVLTWASRADRVLTWGLDPLEREDLLREREADRIDHFHDPEAAMFSLVVRSVRSAISDVWYRLFDNDPSALPLSFMFALIGIAALSDAFTSDFPPLLRLLDISTGVGFLAMAVGGFRRPRELHRSWILPGLVLASVGALGGAIAMPTGGGNAVFGWVNRVGFGAGAVGLAVIALALILAPASRTWVLRGGALIWGAAMLMAVGQIGWALMASPIYSTRGSSLTVAAASVVGAAVIGRTRHLPVVG